MGRPSGSAICSAVADPRQARENATERDLMITQRFTDEAGVTVFEVDRPLEAMDTPIAFACECGTSRCDAVVELPLASYGARAVIAHG